MNFNINEKSGGKVSVIECPPRIDASISGELRDVMKDIVNSEKFNIVLDMSRTNFVDSSGLGALVSRIAAIRSNGGDIRLGSPSENIVRLLETTHLDQIFKCYDDVKSAVESFD